MKQHIVLLTGMSGAGKSSAMNALEDLGYYCIDNFPTELLPNLEAVINKGKRYEYMALAVSAVDYMQFLNFFCKFIKIYLKSYCQKYMSMVYYWSTP